MSAWASPSRTSWTARCNSGFVVYLRRFNFDQGREASILSGTNLIPLYNQLGSQNLLNYSQNSHGFSVSATYPIKRSFARVGVTYGFDISNVVTTTDAAKAYFQYINFSGVAGPNSLSGIRTSHVVPSYTYNTVNHPISPTAGRSLFISTDFAGSILGGNINTIRPSIDVKYFKQAPWHKSHVLAFHALGSLITGYGGKFIAPFSRTYIGGEQDVRGFEIWGITPIAYVASSTSVNVLNDDGSRAYPEDDSERRGDQRAGHHDGPELPAHHARRRHPGGCQLRVPHSDRRAGHDGALRRRRHEPDSASQPAHHGAQPRQRSEQPVPAGRVRRPRAHRARTRKRSAYPPAWSCR